MSHDLQVNDTMFSVREKPWHGLGAVLTEYPKNVDEALRMAGLDWEVESRPVYVVAGDGENVFLDPDHVANVRTDTDDVLGVVSADYRIVQNRECFAFLNELLGGELEFETAGSLGNNRRVWVLVKRPSYITIGGDVVVAYIFMSTSHDGSLAVTCAPTAIRIVCANTLGMAHRAADGRDTTYRVRHTAGVEARVEDARKVLKMTIDHVERYKKMGDALALKKLSAKRLGTVLEDLYPITEWHGERAAATRMEARDAVQRLFRGEGWDGDTTGNAPGTAWCALNAVVEYQDWHRRYTTKTDQMARSFEDTDVKDRALDLLLTV